MRALTAVWASDLRSVVRDRTVGFLLLVPLLLLGFLRVGAPLLARQMPAVADHTVLLVGLFATLAGMFPAFMLAFVMLDERDEGVLAALRVLPVPLGRLLRYRLATVSALSLVYALLLIEGSGLIDRSLLAAVGLAGLCALASPAATLLAVSTASNKIEGLTVFKGLFFVVGLAALGVARDEWWALALMVLPPYWVQRAFVATGAGELAAAAAAAVALHAALIALAYRRFRDRAL